MVQLVNYFVMYDDYIICGDSVFKDRTFNKIMSYLTY